MINMAKTLGAFVLAAASTGAVAEGLDGSGPILCAATSTAVCEQHRECVLGPPEAVNLPVFWHVDPVTKTVKSKRGAGEVRSSTVTTVTKNGGMLILQGSDEGLGWSVSINPSSGKMVLTGGRDIGYLVFGTCTAL